MDWRNLKLGFFSGMLIVFGIVLIAAGFVVRRFWPHRQGSVEFWILSFACSQWLSFVINGAMLLFLGMLLAWLGIMGGAPWL